MMQGEPLVNWWVCIPYFLLVAMSVFLAYPVFVVGAGVFRRRFRYGSIWKEAPVILSAAGVDTLVTAFPLYVMGLPWWYVLVGLSSGTALMGLLYRRHHEEWSRTLAYGFAVCSRVCLGGLVAAFMWQVGYIG